MGTLKTMARRRSSLLLAATALSFSLGWAVPSHAAFYDPYYFYLTGAFSFDSVNPKKLNETLGLTTGKVQGILSGRLKIERGLKAPNLTHWVEFGYFSGSASALDGTGTISRENTLSYLGLIPLGATYWFSRTSFVDFGVSLGLGVGLSPQYTSVATPGVETVSKGGVSPIIDGRFEGRFWVNKYLGVTATGGSFNGLTLIMPVDTTGACSGCDFPRRPGHLHADPTPSPVPSPSPSSVAGAPTSGAAPVRGSLAAAAVVAIAAWSAARALRKDE